MRKILAVLALLISSAIALADINILPENRVKNKPSGCCFWAALESIGRTSKIKQLEGITERRHKQSEELILTENWMIDENGNFKKVYVIDKRNDAPATEWDAIKELKKLGVKHKMQARGNKDTGIIEESMKKDLGCVIGIKDWPDKGDMHAVALTHFGDDGVRFVDSNGKCKEYKFTKEWWDEHWTGTAIIIYPDS